MQQQQLSGQVQHAPDLRELAHDLQERLQLQQQLKQLPNLQLNVPGNDVAGSHSACKNSSIGNCSRNSMQQQQSMCEGLSCTSTAGHVVGVWR